MEVKDTHIDTEEDFLDALENSGSPDCQERERLLADNGKLEDARLLADCRQAFIRWSVPMPGEPGKNSGKSGCPGGKGNGSCGWELP